MKISDVRRIIAENNLNQAACPIDPPAPIEGALCLFSPNKGGWHLQLNERGNFVVNEEFDSEDSACRRFLQIVLSDPTYRRNFFPEDLIDRESKARALLEKYNLLV